VQIALTKAIAKLHTYRGESALFTWLCAITRNEMSDWLARQGRYRQHIVLIEDYPEIQAAVDSFQAPGSDNPEQSYQRAELVRLIQVALDRLPPKYGNVLEWKYIEGYSVGEIAEKLDLGKEATQSLLARAKRAFSDVYGSLSGPARSAMTGLMKCWTGTKNRKSYALMQRLLNFSARRHRGRLRRQRTRR
jgi:RNA polymerase sigma-70 factor (ECF subfamily)